MTTNQQPTGLWLAYSANEEGERILEPRVGGEDAARAWIKGEAAEWARMTSEGYTTTLDESGLGLVVTRGDVEWSDWLLTLTAITDLTPGAPIELD